MHLQRRRRVGAAAMLGLQVLESRLLMTASYTFSTLLSFNSKLKIDGSAPNSLVMDAGGNLFGTTAGGGTKGYGTVFEILAGTSTVVTLASFTGANGFTPNGKIVLDASGNLFGVATNGGANNFGTIWELPQGASTITALAHFTKTTGSHPFGGLTADAAGNLFGTTLQEGAAKRGTVFELVKDASTITVLASFTATKAGGSSGSVVVNAGGNVFGTTFTGGTRNAGSLFEVVKDSGVVTTRASFGATGIGIGPTGTLLMDAGGNFFGMTSTGGTKSKGTLFKIDVGTYAIHTLASFTGTQGARPSGTLIMDVDGNLFGTTATGGTKSVGTAYMLPAGTSTINMIHSFIKGPTGAFPSGGLVLDGTGTLFGTTFSGGVFNNGTIFKLVPVP